MICKHECNECGIEFEHLCHSPPKEPLGLLLIYQYQIDYMPPCNKEDYFMDCVSCRNKKEMLR